jgi:hypothetical protein
MPPWNSRRRLNGLLIAVLAGGLTIAAEFGCQSPPAPGLVSCPLPTTEQVHEILAIAPLGTPRDDVLQKLTQAGISGSFGENQSLYYCDLWKRKDDLRWHLNVVLLFDDEGKLYATRPDASGRVDPTPRSNAKPTSTATSDPFLAE